MRVSEDNRETLGLRINIGSPEDLSKQPNVSFGIAS